MSLSTRCPSCGTTFKVVPDQLKVSEGWVRCGQCAEVFDASAHLRPLAEMPSAGPAVGSEPDDRPGAPALSAAPLPAAPAAPAAPDEPPAVWMRRSPAARVLLHGETLERREPSLDPEPDPAPEPDAGENEVYDEGEVPSALLLQTADNDEPQQSLYQPAFVPPQPDAGTPEARADEQSGDAAATLRELQFVRIAERRAFWQRPTVVAASLAVCLALVAVLGLQVVRTERDRLAAYLPGLQPWLVSLCRPLGCAVAPLQQVDAVVIDNSAFNKVRGELFQFDLEVRNTAGIALAMPAIELTLTDSQDLPLLRRVLLPADLRAEPVLPAGAAWNGSLPVRMAAPVAADRVAGYRVLAFYP